MSTIYYAASSVDGFIATPEHSLDWLLTRDIDRAGPMNYDAFIATVGAIAMGSHTYEWIRDHTDSVWEYDQPCWVFTTRPLEAFDGGEVRFTRANVQEVYDELVEAAAGKNIWVCGGGELAARFADAGLLDEVWVQYAPVALGAGAPLLPRHVELQLVELAQNRDFGCARYAVIRPTVTPDGTIAT
jgi:dihydrofolate reductase